MFASQIKLKYCSFDDKSIDFKVNNINLRYFFNIYLIINTQYHFDYFISINAVLFVGYRIEVVYRCFDIDDFQSRL